MNMHTWLVLTQAVMLASYLVELAQVDAGQLKYSYSMQAAAAVYAALRTMGEWRLFVANMSVGRCCEVSSGCSCAAIVYALVDRG